MPRDIKEGPRPEPFDYAQDRLVEGAGSWTLGVDQWAVGVKEAQCKEGTWRDAEDGHLSGNAVFVQNAHNQLVGGVMGNI